jgi:hypothetical protein
MLFNWIFSVAFPRLVPAYLRIHCFTLDGCRAINSTRGCSATARLKGTHGRERRDDRINAGNSWLCTSKRFCDTYGGPTNFAACAADDSASFVAVPARDAAQQIKHERIPSKLHMIWTLRPISVRDQGIAACRPAQTPTFAPIEVLHVDWKNWGKKCFQASMQTERACILSS